MKTQEIIDLIARTVAGCATEAEQRQLDLWRAENPRNERLYRQIATRFADRAEYERWKSVDTKGPAERMAGRLKREKPHWRTILIPVLLGAAAGLALFFLLRTGIGNPSPSAMPSVPTDYIASIVPGHVQATLTDSDGESYELVSDRLPDAVSVAKPVADRQASDRQALNNLSVPRGGEFHIILEDSTEVWLNAASSLQYPDVFGAEERSVAVTGEAFFKVAADERPFRVKSAGQVVQVFGTEFCVNAYPEDNNVYTTLVSGKIGIRPNDESSSILYLTPDHQSVFSKADETIEVNPVNAKVVTSWKDGMFVFENQTLAQIMVQLSRWYDFEYRFEDESAAAIQFKGRLPRYGKFGDVLDVLEASGRLSFRAEGKCILISKAK